MEKARSPFYPEMPVPPEEFVGRQAIISRIRARGLGQVAAGRSYSFFIEGEYSFGKTSLAQYVMRLAGALGTIAMVARGEYRFSLPIVEAHIAMRAHPGE